MTEDQKKSTSLNIHGTLTLENMKEQEKDTKFYGPKRVELGRVVKEIWQKHGFSKQHMFLEGGSLLGAFRGAMIPHDDDFDFGIYVEDQKPTDDVRRAIVKEWLKLFEKHLPEAYNARIVETYSWKVEVYDPKWGKYPFRDSDFHNVTVDVALFLEHDKDTFKNQHQAVPQLFKKKYLLPLKPVEFCGLEFPCPCETKLFLEQYYGYLGPDCVFDKKTDLYVKRES